MPRHKRKVSDYEAIMDGADATNKIVNLINSKTGNSIVSKDRSVFLLNLIELNNIVEKNRIGEKNTIAITKSKNVLQSLSYLILNDIFYKEIIHIRKELGIPCEGFIVKEGDAKVEEVIFGNCTWYVSRSYKYKYDSNKAYEKIKKLIGKYGLCRKNDLAELAHILTMFLAYQMDFYSFFQMIAPKILGKEKKSIMVGLDTKLKEYKDSSNNFFTCEWGYKIYPFTNLTNLEKLFSNFLKRELMTEQGFKKYTSFLSKKFKNENEKNNWKLKNGISDCYEVDYMNFLAKKFKVYENRKLIKSKEKLEVCNKKDFVLLAYTTNYFTKTSDVIKLYKNKLKIIKSLLKQIESHNKINHIKYLSEHFEENHLIARLRKRNLTYDEVSAFMYANRKGLGDSYRNRIKVEWSDFNANIKKALQHKIVF